ncbi:Acb2/Tad1 domain-containing protein [Aquicella siphonis]
MVRFSGGNSTEELFHAIETPQYADARMKAIAKTNLEQAVMWAVKGVTNPPKA